MKKNVLFRKELLQTARARYFQEETMYEEKTGRDRPADDQGRKITNPAPFSVKVRG